MIKAFLISMVSFIVLDSIWFGYITRDFNMRQLKHIGNIVDDQFKIAYGPALAVYILMTLAIVVFVFNWIKPSDPIYLIFARGAFMGFLVYGVFDMTNAAILRNYPFGFALADMAWGTVSFGIATTLAYKFGYSLN